MMDDELSISSKQVYELCDRCCVHVKRVIQDFYIYPGVCGTRLIARLFSRLPGGVF